MVLGFTAINWILLLASTLVWPLVAVVIYFIWRSAKRHGHADEEQRRALLEAAAAAEQARSSES
jgi:heme/copper-type cytochrome/quinol oxidase subunit 2